MTKRLLVGGFLIEEAASKDQAMSRSQARMLQKIPATPAVAGEGLAVLNMELGPLAIEFGFSDVPKISQPPGIGEALAQHWRDKHSSFDPIKCRIPVPREREAPVFVKKISVLIGHRSSGQIY